MMHEHRQGRRLLIPNGAAWTFGSSAHVNGFIPRSSEVPNTPDVEPILVPKLDENVTVAKLSKLMRMAQSLPRNNNNNKGPLRMMIDIAEVVLTAPYGIMR